MKIHPSKVPLIPDRFFHIYNHGNNDRNIFFKEDNFKYFLNKFALYLLDYVDVYAYCLMINHFHMLIKLKPKKSIQAAIIKDFSNNKPKDLSDF